MTRVSDENVLEQEGRLDEVTDRYEVASEVAGGDRERVYRGSERDSGDAVAIRVVQLEGPSRLEDIQSPQIIQRDHLPGGDERPDGEGPGDLWEDSGAEDVVDETVLRRLNHPGIGGIRAVCTDAGAIAIVADAVDGDSVAEGLGRDQWIDDPDGAAELGHDVANALAYLHGEGVLHLDVQPANIIRGQTGRFRLANSGVATLLQQELGDDALRATPAYVAPERLRADGDIGPWTDLYALGVVLYEAMTGDVPFTGPSVGDTLEAHLDSEPEPPAAVNPKVDRFLSRLVCRLLATDPEERYRSAAELRWDLQMYLGDRDGDRRGMTRRPRIWDPAPSDAPPFFIARPVTEPIPGRLVDGPDEQTRVAVVRGEPESGKTAILERQADRLRDRGLIPVPARASRHPAAIAVVEQLARGAVKALEEADEVDEQAWRDHLQGVSPAARGLAARIDSLGEWIQPGSRTDARVDNRRMRAVAGWRDLFEHFLTGPTPFVWVVDDIHEIDALSKEIVTEFVCRRSGSAGRWLVSRTPGENEAGDQWMEGDIEASDRCVATVDLSPLTRRAVEEALGYVIQTNDEERSRLFDWLMERSGGRPRHLQIAYQQLVEAGAIQFRAGNPRFIASQLEEADPTTTPAAYVTRHWQTLDLPERELATKVALFDDPLPYRLLSELVSHDVEDLHRHLTELAQRHLVETMTLGDQTWVWCPDRALRNAIGETLGDEERPRQHRMVAFELCDAHERVDETAFHDSWLAVQAACHWVGAGETARAAEWFGRSGAARLDEGRVSNAVGLLRQAEKRVDDVVDRREHGRSLAELLGDALAAVGDDEEAADYYARAVDAPDFGELGPETRRLRLKLARTLQRRRRFEESRDIVGAFFRGAGLEIPEERDRLTPAFFLLLIQLSAMQWLDWLGGLEREWIGDDRVETELSYLEAGRLESATLVDDHFSLAPWFRYKLGLRALSNRDPRLLAMTYASQGVSWCRGEKSSPAYARRFREQAIERLEAVGDPRIRAYVGAAGASISLAVGDREEAFELAHRYLPVALDAGAFSEYVRLLEVLVSLALQGGNLAAVDYYTHRLGADARAFGGVEVRHVTRLFQAHLAFLRGDYAEARECVDAARSVNTRVQDPARAAQIDGIDLELLWREERYSDAVELARATVDRIDEGLYGDALTETLCRAARIGVRASRAARDGELDARPETLLSFAERCVSLAEERTEAFPTFRALVRCEQGRLADERDEPEIALDHLDAAVRLADRAGLTRFQMLAYQLRSRLHGRASPYRAVVDARRARMLAVGCGMTADVESLDEQIRKLHQSARDLEPFLRGAPAPVTAEADDAAAPPELPSEAGGEGTIQLSPDETAVEFITESDADATTVSSREEPDTTRWPLPSSPEVIPESTDTSGEREAADGGAAQSAELSQESAMAGPPTAGDDGETDEAAPADRSSEVSLQEGSEPPPATPDDEGENGEASDDGAPLPETLDEADEREAASGADHGERGDESSDDHEGGDAGTSPDEEPPETVDESGDAGGDPEEADRAESDEADGDAGDETADAGSDDVVTAEKAAAAAEAIGDPDREEVDLDALRETADLPKDDLDLPPIRDEGDGEAEEEAGNEKDDGAEDGGGEDDTPLPSSGDVSDAEPEDEDDETARDD